MTKEAANSVGCPLPRRISTGARKHRFYKVPAALSLRIALSRDARTDSGMIDIAPVIDIIYAL